MKRWTIALTCTALFAISGCASSPETQTAAAEETELEHFSEMNWQEVADAMSKGAVLVDARSADGYAEGHIEGAINIPSGDEAAFASLPEDKGTQLIFYCGGPKCKASTRGATMAKKMGFTQIAEYKGGYPEWKELTGGQASAN